MYLRITNQQLTFFYYCQITLLFADADKPKPPPFTIDIYDPNTHLAINIDYPLPEMKDINPDLSLIYPPPWHYQPVTPCDVLPIRNDPLSRLLEQASKFTRIKNKKPYTQKYIIQ